MRQSFDSPAVGAALIVGCQDLHSPLGLNYQDVGLQLSTDNLAKLDSEIEDWLVRNAKREYQSSR